MTIRLLYGLTKEALRAMRRTELDDVARRLQSTAEDAAGQLGKKNQGQFDATKKAVDQEKRTRQIRDEEYSIMQQEEKALNEWIPQGPVSEARGVGSLARKEGGTALPEFTSSNLSKTLSREGVDPNMDKLGWGGRLVSQVSSPTKYKNIRFEDLNQAQQDVYKVIRDMKSYGDLPQELGHPGVLSDLLEEAGRAGEKIYRYQGDGPRMFVSNYWRKKGPMIRKEWNTVQETGDFTTGTSFEEIIEGIKRID
tara:strand:+ start:5581 stop:6336 length:756 start_codon:yes stop_codon:yes gene_type:complete